MICCKGVTEVRINKAVSTVMILSFLLTCAVYPQLPELIPGHWNFRGEIDRMVGKNMVFFTALLPLAIYALLYFIPRIDPKGESYQKHPQAYAITAGAVVLFLIAIHWLTILASLGRPVDIGVTVRLLTGVLFAVIGNSMSQIRPNFFFGIRTPWTLANETVWRKTHRFGGYAFIFSGLLLAVSVFFTSAAAMYFFFGCLLISVLGTVVYSYLEYKKLVS